MRTHYIATDLELESQQDLSLIVEEFGEDVHVHFQGKVGDTYCVFFGLVGAIASENEAISMFCSLAESLSPDGQNIWESCSRIDFDLGYQAVMAPKSCQSRLTKEIIERVVNLNGDIVITIYAPEDKST